MGKRSTGKKRGIQRGVARHKIQSKAVKGKETARRILGVEESVWFSVGGKCFDFWFYWCEKLYLVPFTRTAGGIYVALDRKSQVIHYFVWFLKFLMLLHKAWGLGTMLVYEELKIETFMCISLFLIYFVSICISLGVVGRPKETMDLLNSWPYILSSLKELRNDVPSEFEDLSEAFELVAQLLASQGVALAAALLSLAFSTLPTCYFPAIESLGLIPEGVLPRFAWQLIFFPLEYATYIPPMLIVPLNTSISLILVGVYRIYITELR